MSLPVPNLALALSAKVALDPVNTLKAFAVNVKSSAPASLISIWSSVSAVRLVSPSASIINSLPCELFDEDCHSCAKSEKCKYKKYTPKQKRKVGKSGKCVPKTHKARYESLYIKNNHTKCGRINDDGGGAAAPKTKKEGLYSVSSV